MPGEAHRHRSWLVLSLGLLAACARAPASAPGREPPPRSDALPPPVAASSAPRRYLGFDAAKRALTGEIYRDHRTEAYCGCAFDRELRVERASCGYEPRANAARGARVEWEHVMPAARFGRELSCWAGESAGCRSAGARGRRCCARAEARGGDPTFHRREGDLHNLVPAVGELNGDRSDRPFGLVAGEARRYGACDFEIDLGSGRAGPVEPPPAVWGDVARAWLYMRDEHDIPLTPDETRLLQAWHEGDPPDAWEVERSRRIAAVQGNDNPWVTGLEGRGR